MTEEPTCGQGLAEQGLTPRLMAVLLDAVADNLGAHLTMLVADDADTQHERRIYEELSRRHREAATMLRTLARQLGEQQDMRMGQHDVEAMSHDEVTKALADLVDAEAQLAARLEGQLAEHRAMVEEMGS